MGRREDDARLAGMMYAYKQIKEHGLDYFKKELQNRGAYHIAVAISNADLTAASKAIREQTFDTMMVMSLLTLHDEFDFGKTRLERFMQRFESKSNALATDGQLKWEDYAGILRDECGINIHIRYNEEVAS